MKGFSTLLHMILKRLHQSSNFWAAKSKSRQEARMNYNQADLQGTGVSSALHHMGLANPLPWHGEVFPLPWNMLWTTGFGSQWLEQKSTCSAFSWPATACANHCVHRSMRNGWKISCPHCCCWALLCFTKGKECPWPEAPECCQHRKNLKILFPTVFSS